MCDRQLALGEKESMIGFVRARFVLSHRDDFVQQRLSDPDDLHRRSYQQHALELGDDVIGEANASVRMRRR